MKYPQAFPVDRKYNPKSESIDLGHDGMTLLDFFASQAPTEIPAWFDPEPLHDSKPQEPISVYQFAKDHDPTGEYGLYSTLSDWFRDPCYDFSEGTMERKFQDIIENYWAEKAIWDNNNQIARYFKWRWYYAQQMLKERQNWIGGNNGKENN